MGGLGRVPSVGRMTVTGPSRRAGSGTQERRRARLGPAVRIHGTYDDLLTGGFLGALNEQLQLS